MGKIIGLTFKETEHTCPHCGRAYKSADALGKHIREKHPDVNGVPADTPGQK